ncbi:MAG: nucleotide pyrophosphohydrolase [Planctomycetota bacterium]|nr:MAG: nucleotide pyrophosphohydrolase [Planctomycetota bacterium]REJ94127.1 MAG: nucleotide pyrophosphohydrolase [Planctomycetota bacterium]REK26313.1 MAG: nucleotide pyrophosphohydrolase [Planctomycetota bacterium]REK45864.1 MAG: nucleotide pyrophosphohydrolase [Planctomycetota bacterium]
MSDATTNLGELRDAVAAFVAERDWEQFHAPKNLAMALAIEAAELMEHFQWISAEKSRTLRGDREQLVPVGEEMADVLCYLLALANELEIDLAAAFADKMRKNVAKYPAEQYRGRYGPEDRGDAAAEDY